METEENASAALEYQKSLKAWGEMEQGHRRHYANHLQDLYNNMGYLELNRD